MFANVLLINTYEERQIQKSLSEIFDGVLQFLKRTSAPATLGIPEARSYEVSNY